MSTTEERINKSYSVLNIQEFNRNKNSLTTPVNSLFNSLYKEKEIATCFDSAF